MLKLEGTAEDITYIFRLEPKLRFGDVFLPDFPTKQTLTIIKS